MTDQTPPPPSFDKTPADVPAPPAAPEYAPPPPVHAPNAYGMVPQMGPGPIGKVRSTGIAILLFFVTFGIYGLYWYFVTHEEMKQHTGRGLGGLVALILAFFVGIVMPFFTSGEVGNMQELGGRQRTVSAATGLWYFPGMFLIVLPFVWFVKTNGALNEYWKSLGAPA